MTTLIAPAALPALPVLREHLQTGGVLVVWCGAGGAHDEAAAAARQEGVRLLASLGLEGLYISRSACAGLGAVALSLCAPVGIDVEAVSSVPAHQSAAWLHPREAESMSHTSSRAGLQVWVRKEAVLKALGIGLAVAPCAFEAGGEDHAWRGVQVGAHGVPLVRSVATPSSAVLCSIAVRQSPGPSLLACGP